MLLMSCSEVKRQEPVAPEKQSLDNLEKIRADLVAVRRALEAETDKVEMVKSASDSAQRTLAEKDQQLAAKETLIKDLQGELDRLKKQDAIVFAEISAIQQQGLPGSAVSRYEKFIDDYPKSPLVVHARAAIENLTGEIQRQDETRRATRLENPILRKTDVMSRIREGNVTSEELAPQLRRRSISEVTALLGSPSQTFRDGSLGFADKAIDSYTGERSMLIVEFTSGRVSSFRVGYTGQRVVP